MQVDWAVEEMLSNSSGPDKVVAVLDARGASTLQVTRHIQLFKETAVALNQVCPAARLGCCRPSLMSSHGSRVGAALVTQPSLRCMQGVTQHRLLQLHFHSQHGRDDRRLCRWSCSSFCCVSPCVHLRGGCVAVCARRAE